MQARSRLAGFVPAAVVLVVLTGCQQAASDDEDDEPAGRRMPLPPAGAMFDYQLGGAYPPPAGVEIVTRDRAAEPASGRYSICYVNAFQAQPDDLAWWQAEHADLLLTDDAGEYVVDAEWDEVLLDTSTRAKRSALAGIVGEWIADCADRGFDAIEPDNLDSWTRSGGLLSEDAALDYVALLAQQAHDGGLAIAQKNTPELGERGRSAGLDFAVAEECGRYDECAAYTDVYGDHVIVVEYREPDFDLACARWGESLPIVLRDLDVSPSGSPGYVFAAC